MDDRRARAVGDVTTGTARLTAAEAGVTAFGGVLPAAVAASRLVREPRIPIRDNTEFVKIFDKTTFVAAVKPTATKTVVVDQDPDAGAFVPLGTPINLIVTVKEVIPVGSFKGVASELALKYPIIGALTSDLDAQVGHAAKDALEKNVDYDALSTQDKTAVDDFMRDKLGGTAVDTEDKRKKIYKDVRFLYQL